MIGTLRRYFRRRRYAPGACLTEWLAPDIRRDVEVVDASEIDSGIVTARIRTWNVMYAAHAVADMPAFGEPRRIEIRTLWQWDGEPWGGPVPPDDDGAENKDGLGLPRARVLNVPVLPK